MYLRHNIGMQEYLVDAGIFEIYSSSQCLQLNHSCDTPVYPLSSNQAPKPVPGQLQLLLLDRAAVRASKKPTPTRWPLSYPKPPSNNNLFKLSIVDS